MAIYIDEAQDYFDRNIGLILTQARKYNVGMVLAHQYLGQLEPKLQEAFAANTAIKFAGGVSAKDARALAPMLYTQAEFIESQGKGSFAAHVRGVTKSAVPLSFPFGHLEGMDKMSGVERRALQASMRERYANHHSQLGQEEAEEEEEEEEESEDREPDIEGSNDRSRAKEPPPSKDDKRPPGHIDTTPGENW